MCFSLIIKNFIFIIIVIDKQLIADGYILKFIKITNFTATIIITIIVIFIIVFVIIIIYFRGFKEEINYIQIN